MGSPKRQTISGETSRGRSPEPDPTGSEDSPLSQVPIYPPSTPVPPFTPVTPYSMEAFFHSCSQHPGQNLLSRTGILAQSAAWAALLLSMGTLQSQSSLAGIILTSSFMYSFVHLLLETDPSWKDSGRSQVSPGWFVFGKSTATLVSWCQMRGSTEQKIGCSFSSALLVVACYRSHLSTLYLCVQTKEGILNY